MKATVNGRTFEAGSWTEVLASVLMAVATKRTSSGERKQAVSQLKSGVSVVIGGVLIKPEGARE